MESIANHQCFKNHNTLASIQAAVVEVAQAAGQMIMAAIHTTTQDNIHLKSRVDLVTDTDRKVESFVVGSLRTLFPGSRFLAEEQVSLAADEAAAEQLSNEPTWIIDPIDGTTNFVHKHPVFCVSIALAVEGQVVVGVVLNPVLHELFTATLGGGAFLNGAPIRVSSAASLDKAVVATNVGVDRTPEGVEFILENIRKLLLNNVQSVRSNGSSAWEMSSVACGRLDVFYERGIHAWDIAAAVLLITEAGGVVANLDGSELNLLGRQIMCGNQNMVNIISNLLFSSK